MPVSTNFDLFGFVSLSLFMSCWELLWRLPVPRDRFPGWPGDLGGSGISARLFLWQRGAENRAHTEHVPKEGCAARAVGQPGAPAGCESIHNLSGWVGMRLLCIFSSRESSGAGAGRCLHPALTPRAPSRCSRRIGNSLAGPGGTSGCWGGGREAAPEDAAISSSPD